MSADLPAEFLTRKQLARRLSVEAHTITRWVRRGWLPEIRLSPKTAYFNWPDVAEALLKMRGADHADQ